MLDVPPANHCVAVPPAPVEDENPLHPPQEPPLHQATIAAISALAPNHQPFPVIVENTELLPIVPFVEVPHQAPPAPIVTVYACGVTTKAALFWYHPAPAPAHHCCVPHQNPHPHPHPHPTTSAFTVAIIFKIKNYLRQRDNPILYLLHYT